MSNMVSMKINSCDNVLRVEENVQEVIKFLLDNEKYDQGDAVVVPASHINTVFRAIEAIKLTEFIVIPFVNYAGKGNITMIQPNALCYIIAKVNNCTHSYISEVLLEERIPRK